MRAEAQAHIDEIKAATALLRRFLDWDRALRRLDAPAPGGIVAVGTVFTEEALALLAEAGARVVAFRKARWTDESANQRQL